MPQTAKANVSSPRQFLACLLALCVVTGCASRRTDVTARPPLAGQPEAVTEVAGEIVPVGFEAEANAEENLLPSPPTGESESEVAQADERAEEDSTEAEEQAAVTLPPPLLSETSTQLIGATGLTVEQLVGEAVSRSPKVLAAKHRAAAAERRVPQVTSYDDPQFGSVYAPIDSNSLQTAGGRVPLTVTLTQKLPWRDKLTVRGAAACDEARRLWMLAEEAELDVAYRVRTAAADFWFAGEAIRIAESDRTVLDSLEDVAKARVRSGASQQDVLNARLESDRLQTRIVQLERLRGVAAAELAALTGRSVQSVEGLELAAPAGNVGASIDSSVAEAIACRPELKSHLFAVSRDRHKRRLASLESYPDFNVGLGWQSVRNDQALSPVANGNDNINLIVGMSLPIWHGRIDAGIAEAEQQVLASSRDYDATLDSVRRDIAAAVVRAETLEAQRSVYEEKLVPRAEQALEVSLADYRGEKVTFVQLSENYLSVLSLRTESARLRSETEKALAALDRAVGCRQAAASQAHPCP